MKIFAHSPKDLIPVASALAHTAYLIFLFVIFPVTPWWMLIPLGFIHSVHLVEYQWHRAQLYPQSLLRVVAAESRV